MSLGRTVRSLFLVLAAAGVTLAGCGGSGAGRPPPAARFVLGTWHGTLFQRDLAPFRVTVTVGSLSGAAINPVHYSGLGCGGLWTYLGARGATVHFREVIDSGRSATCKGAGTITLTRAGARLRYRFSGGGVVSRGLLSRGG